MKFGVVHNDDAGCNRAEVLTQYRHGFFFAFKFHDGSSEWATKSNVLYRLNHVVNVKPPEEVKPRLLKMRIIPFSDKLMETLIPKPDAEGNFNISGIFKFGRKLNKFKAMNGFQFIHKYGGKKLKQAAVKYEVHKK